MIRIYIPGLIDSDVSSNDSRKGDITIVESQYVDVIDGGCGAYSTRLVSYLKKRKIKEPYLHITHAHYDHYYGIRQIIRDSYFNPKMLYCYDPDSLKDVSSDAKSNKSALKNIINEAKAKGIPITYLKNSDKITHGDVHIEVYRNQPTKYNGNTDAYINDGSLCYWFPDLEYLTTGDAGLWCAERYKLPVKSFKGGHHGNDNSGDTMKPSQMCRWLKQRGCEFFWDNDYSTTLTDFLMTGREDALNAGMKFLNIHGDINFLACSGKVTIYKGGQHWTYACDYKGKNTLKSPNLTLIEKVIGDEYGSSDTRTTNLLDMGYSPVGVQNHVNKLFKLIKG